MKNITKSIVSTLLIFSGITMLGQNTFPSNGNVGIGTTNPLQKLHIHSTNPASFTLLSGTAPGILFSKTASSTLAIPAIGLSTSSQHYNAGSSIGDFNIRGGAGRDILIGTLTSSSSTNGTERIRIKNNGNIGIGITNPESKLHVDGAITTPSFKTNDKGVIKIRDFGAGETQYNRALFPVYDASLNRTELVINQRGDFENGVKIAGSQLNVVGQVGIGTTDTRGYKLAVNGNILAEELKIRTYVNWPDYVFKNNYELKSLNEIEAYISKNGHLPNIPSADQVKEEGINIGEMNAKLLEKIEELTLHLIQQHNDIRELKKQNKLFENSVKKLKEDSAK